MISIVLQVMLLHLPVRKKCNKCNTSRARGGLHDHRHNLHT